MKKRFRVLIGAALASVLCFAGLTSAYAAPTDEATETSQAAITKLLKVPVGTTVPQAEFEFVVKAKAVDNTPYAFDSSEANMPAIGEAGTIDLSAGTGNFTLVYGGSPAGEKLEDANNILSTYYYQTKNIFAGVLWPHPGLYEYEIAENPGNFTGTLNDYSEIMTYSKEVYSVKVYVQRNVKTRALEITHIGVLMIVDNEGKPIDPKYQGKVDPTPDGGNDPSLLYSQLAFTNTYSKTQQGTNPADPKAWVLEISKAVTGTFAEPLQYFGYTMKVVQPSIIVGNPTYKAFVIEESAIPGVYNVVTSRKNYSGIIGVDKSIMFTSGDNLNINLQANQKLVFLQLPVGTAYEITETGTAGYTPKAEVFYNGNSAGTITAGEGEELALHGKTFDPTKLVVAENKSGAAFTNDRGTVTPTGLDLKEIPFYLLILLSVGAIVAFAFLKTYRKRNDN